MFEQLKEMNAELEQLKKQHLEKSKIMFADVAKQVFEKHPILESFGWRQYTPYFNDGEECTFSAHIDDPYVNEQEEYDDGSRETIYQKVEGEYKDIPNPDYKPEIAAARKDVVEFLKNIDESVLREMFGDHKMITVKRESVEVEEYEHD